MSGQNVTKKMKDRLGHYGNRGKNPIGKRRRKRNAKLGLAVWVVPRVTQKRNRPLYFLEKRENWAPTRKGGNPP